jgi:hypothetical protein
MNGKDAIDAGDSRIYSKLNIFTATLHDAFNSAGSVFFTVAGDHHKANKIRKVTLFTAISRRTALKCIQSPIERIKVKQDPTSLSPPDMIFTNDTK